ncbi:MAG: hypothetical protein HY907_22805 [Deltaproteobacteria bacterium]|nr:hypothetical protein [Deltaproteobacteria bacterium]
MSERKSPFGEFAAVGVHMAQAWEKVLESFWQGLLGDPKRLAELAGKMADAVRGAAAGAGGVRPADVTEVARRLGAVEERLDALEVRIRTLTGNVASLITYLEELSRHEDKPPAG